MATTTKELSKAYGNLLDIDGSQLSADFLQDTENLQLMKAAIEGNEAAYDQLQTKASVNYLQNVLGMTADEA